VNPVVAAIVFVGGSVAYAVIGVIIGRKITHRHVREGHNDVLVPLFLTAGVMYAVLLAFMVVAEWESYDAASSNSAEEAALLTPLYRLSAAMAEEPAAQMREALRAYAEDVAHGWEGFTHGERNHKAGADANKIIQVFATMQPANKARELIDGQFLDNFTQMIFHRNKRYAQAAEHLPWIMWLGAVGGGVLTVGMSFFLYMERRGPHIAMVSMMSALFGLLLFIMTLLSRPFLGPLAIEPGPFETAISVFDDVDHGN
jgi:hypothetical protein